jgi:hypothetical protein
MYVSFDVKGSEERGTQIYITKPEVNGKSDLSE